MIYCLCAKTWIRGESPENDPALKRQCRRKFFFRRQSDSSLTVRHIFDPRPKFTIICPKNSKKSLLCGLISQTSAEMPPKNGGVRKANWLPFFIILKFLNKKGSKVICMREFEVILFQTQSLSIKAV
jgi:hypothetical protein